MTSVQIAVRCDMRFRRGSWSVASKPRAAGFEKGATNDIGNILQFLVGTGKQRPDWVVSWTRRRECLCV